MMAVNLPARVAMEPVRNQVPLLLEGGDGNAFARINELILLMKKLNIEMRDILRGFHDEMQKVAFEKQLLSLDTKQKGIEQTFDAAVATSITQIITGFAGFAGAAVGYGWDNQFISAAASALGKTAEGLGNFSAGFDNRHAQQAQLQGDFQAATADNLAKTLATLAERAAEASRQLREATRELLGLYERLANAVQMRTR
ncbi:secreted effector protein SseD [Pseudomonas sp. JAI115]|uniref:pathogenicity island effector protein n=1 Tax=Pseudomonas sp. JAI115 TaxID=2723061 RepID=UPI001618E048|nr:pathogenicity island effector protein [Pseudomonas sp. JAI115]MBB6155176.1 secreted effector protein SseD [Pseudomonas sp. JAI115]